MLTIIQSCAHPLVISWILYSTCCGIAVLTCPRRKFLKKDLIHKTETKASDALFRIMVDDQGENKKKKQIKEQQQQ